MLLALVVLVGALVTGWAAGGRAGRLGDLVLRRRWLVVLAVAGQVGGALLGGRGEAGGLAVSGLAAAAFLVGNRRVRGVGLLAAGLLANGLVIAANGAMPLSGHAAGRAGVSTQDIVSGTDPRHELAGPGTRLPWLGDVIPVLLPRFPEVVSPGDVAVTAGLAELVVSGMLGSHPDPGGPMARKSRKRRARKKSAANHGKRPNA